MSATRLSDIDYCRMRRDLEISKARRALSNKDYIWVSMCAKQARDWNRALLREMGRKRA